MKASDIELTLKLIRDREDYLVVLQSEKSINVSYWGTHGVPMSGHTHNLFYLNKEEKEYIKSSCIAEIKRLKKTIECLTE